MLTKTKNRRATRALLAGALALLCGLGVCADPLPVDAEIALLIDVSRSVDAARFRQQQEGYVAALGDPALFDGYVAKGALRRIAVCVVYWSSPGQRQMAVGWTLVDSAAAAAALGARLRVVVPFGVDLTAAAHPFNGTTAPGSALHFVAPTFAANEFAGARNIINVSGDGVENDGPPTRQVRDLLLSQGIDTINAIPIGSAALARWFSGNVQGGADAFTEPASDFDTVAQAVRRSLERAISNR